MRGFIKFVPIVPQEYEANHVVLEMIRWVCDYDLQSKALYLLDESQELQIFVLRMAVLALPTTVGATCIHAYNIG